MLLEFRVEALEIESTDDFMRPQRFQKILRFAGDLYDELIKEGRGKRDLRRRERPKFASSVMRFGEVVFGESFQAPLTQEAEIDGGIQGKKGLTGADVGGRPFAPDVLFAGGQGQYKTTAAFAVSGLTHQPSGHLAQEPFSRGQESHVGPAVGDRHPKGLRLSADNVCLAGRTRDSQGKR